MTATGSKEDNFETCSRLAAVSTTECAHCHNANNQQLEPELQDAKQQGCSMLFLPECFSFIGRNLLEVCDLKTIICCCMLPCQATTS